MLIDDTQIVRARIAHFRHMFQSNEIVLTSSRKCCAAIGWNSLKSGTDVLTFWKVNNVFVFMIIAF